jgi:hypothetical protein
MDVRPRPTAKIVLKQGAPGRPFGNSKPPGRLGGRLVFILTIAPKATLALHSAVDDDVALQYTRLSACPESSSAIRLSKLRIIFLKIWIHAIPLVRPPTTRIRLARGVPRIPSVACGAGAGEPSTARGGCRGWPSQRDRAPARAAVARRRDLSWARVRERNAAVQASGSRRRLGGGKFSWLQTLENKRNRIGIPANPPRPREPERCRRPPRLPAGSRDATSVLGAVRRKSARRRMRGGEIFQSATH